MTGCALLAALLAAAPGVGEPPVAAEPLGVRVQLDRREVRLGEPFELDVEIRHLPAERYSLPAAAPGDPFRLLGVACPRREEGREAVTACALRLALFDLGPHDLPELRLRAETPSGPRELRIPGPTIVGAGILDPAAPPEALALRELAPPAPLLVPDTALALGALAALLAVAACWRASRAWRRRARRGEPPPPLPPHERFARQLDALDAERLVERGRGREHVSRLSVHVREYLASLTGQRALELTSAELLARLSFLPDPRIEPRALQAFLEGADLVKFARAHAPEGDAAAATAYARALLDATRPRPVAPEPEAG